MPVYVMADMRGEDVFVKFGRTENVVSRINQLQTGNPSPLILLVALQTDDDVGVERALLDRFRYAQVSREWFRWTLEVGDFLRACRWARAYSDVGREAEEKAEWAKVLAFTGPKAQWVRFSDAPCVDTIEVFGGIAICKQWDRDNPRDAERLKWVSEEASRRCEVVKSLGVKITWEVYAGIRDAIEDEMASAIVQEIHCEIMEGRFPWIEHGAQEESP